ncbi:MAG: response regulator [Bacteroidetes bacterium]|nr:response regulator [Bacteroidota bacterium]MBS1685684.1 response regulator [Bacteroidota bacterium]
MESKSVEILLVEDNPYEAELAIRGLKKHNFANNLHHIDDGAEALDFIFGRGKYADHTETPKLILLDIKLPRIDGIEILRQIKSNEKTRSIPVVVLTSSKENQDVKACYELGVNSYIVKPVDFDSFAKAVAELGMYWMLLNTAPPR